MTGQPLALLIGAMLAGAVLALLRLAGLDRDRAVYPVMLIVIASYYLLFAIMAGSTATLLMEMVTFLPFVAAAIAGFRRLPWLVAGGLAGHAAFDALHPHLIANAGVPPWWPPFCLAFDLAAAAIVAVAQSRSIQRTEPSCANR